MNAPLFLETLARRDETPQADLPLAAEAVMRYVWQSKFGFMLIEVVGGRIYVDGQLVEPVEAPAATDPSSTP